MQDYPGVRTSQDILMLVKQDLFDSRNSFLGYCLIEAATVFGSRSCSCPVLCKEKTEPKQFADKLALALTARELVSLLSAKD